MNRLAVINVVGLTESLIGEHTPRIAEFRQRGALARIAPAFPAVTCTAQSNYLTGSTPTQHGIVGNGWYNRELAEVQFWKQSNHLVQQPKIWDELRNQSTLVTRHSSLITVANCFWWFNMHSRADYSITPRPMYPADGRKIFDIYTWPYSIRTEIKRDLGEFPFFGFWGPAAGIKTPQGAADAATRWIAGSAKWIENKYTPTLNLVYLPHLDYNLQRHGPFSVGDEVSSRITSNIGNRKSEIGNKLALPHVGSYKINPDIVPDLHAVDAIVGDLIDFFSERGVPGRFYFPNTASRTWIRRSISTGFSGSTTGWHPGRTRPGNSRCRREPGFRRGRPPGRAHLSERPFARIRKFETFWRNRWKRI